MPKDRNKFGIFARMKTNLLIKTACAALALLLCGTASARPISPDDWTAEDHSGRMELRVEGDTLDIVSPKGVTLWYRPRLEGDYEISYRACVCMQEGPHDRLGDLNCFWGANDPVSPDDLFARGAWRNGIFPRYKTLTLFYVGYGGNNNTTTRFRRYYGAGEDCPDATARPVIREYLDPDHLLHPNRWLHIVIRVEQGMTTYSVDGEELFRLTVEPGACDGHFALRLLENHVRIAGFEVKPL